MKKFRFSLIYLGLLFVSAPFHLQLEKAIVSQSVVLTLLNYGMVGVFIAFFLVALWRTTGGGRVSELAALFLAITIIFYFIFQRRVFLHAQFFSFFLHLVEFFILGFLLLKENKKKFAFLPFAILFLAALTFELLQRFLPHRIFDWNDIWLNVIAGLAGSVVGTLLAG